MITTFTNSKIAKATRTVARDSYGYEKETFTYGTATSTFIECQIDPTVPQRIKLLAELRLGTLVVVDKVGYLPIGTTILPDDNIEIAQYRNSPGDSWTAVAATARTTYKVTAVLDQQGFIPHKIVLLQRPENKGVRA